VKTYEIPGTVRPRKRGEATYKTTFAVEAEDRADARWKVHHGVIESAVTSMHGQQARCHYDLRRMRRAI
jgi:hypothetical protein